MFLAKANYRFDIYPPAKAGGKFRRNNPIALIFKWRQFNGDNSIAPIFKWWVNEK